MAGPSPPGSCAAPDAVARVPDSPSGSTFIRAASGMDLARLRRASTSVSGASPFGGCRYRARRGRHRQQRGARPGRTLALRAKRHRTHTAFSLIRPDRTVGATATSPVRARQGRAHVVPAGRPGRRETRRWPGALLLRRQTTGISARSGIGRCRVDVSLEVADARKNPNGHAHVVFADIR